MAKVDPEDDSITRYVVRHYRYDPDRRERRYVAVAAYDNSSEFEAALEDHHANLQQAKLVGDADIHELVSGQVLHPGHSSRAQNRRLVHRAIQHGVAPPESALADLPDGTAVVRFARRSSGSGDRSTQRPTMPH